MDTTPSSQQTSTEMACVVCEQSWESAASPVRIEACPGCGLPTTVPRPGRDIESDELFVEGYAGDRLAKQAQWLREARTRLQWIQQWIPRGRLLEVGAATGELIFVAEEAGYEATGVETSQWAVEASRALTNSVVQADLGEWLPAQERFDVICAFHTLEHIPDPRAFLETCVSGLSDEGRVFLEVPNGEARDMRDGAGWLGAQLTDHIAHYRTSDLERLLGSVGLAVESSETFTMETYDSPLVWKLRRARWLAKGRTSPSEDFLRVVARRS